MKIKLSFLVFLNLFAIQSAVSAEDTAHAAHNHAAESTASAPATPESTGGMNVSAKTINLKGVDVLTVSEKELTNKIRFNGKVDVDETKVTHIQAKMMGWIEDLHVGYVGQTVKKQEPLFSIYSQDLIAAQEEYLLALENANHPVPGSLAQDAQSATQQMLQSSKRKLELLDIPDSEIQRLEKAKHALRALTILSPATGVVLSKTATKGMNVMPGMDLYVIADLSKLWVNADVYETDLETVSVGSHATFYGNDSPMHIMSAQVNFISPTVDEKSRTIKVRIEVDNRDGHMKPGMYGTVEIAKSFGSHLAVPKSALIDTGQRKVVFVQTATDAYAARDIKIGHAAGDWIEVADGLHPGEKIAVSGQFLLDADTTIQAGGSVHQHGGSAEHKK